MRSFFISFVVTALLSAQADAGDTKVLDGTKAPKDSVAQLKVQRQIGSEYQDSSIYLFVSQIDSSRLQELIYPDFKDSQLSTTPEEPFLRILEDEATAKKISSVKVRNRPHVLLVKAFVRHNTTVNTEFLFSPWLNISFTPVGGHSYELDGTLMNGEWEIRIVDRKSKEVVATSRD